MSETIDFYFDFSSPYGYLASLRAEEIERKTRYNLVWRPILLGAIFKNNGRQPLANQPVIWQYARKDIERVARKARAPYKLPDPFPVATVAAGRTFYWLEKQRGSETAIRFAEALFRAYYVNNRNISNASVVTEIALEQGTDERELALALADDTAKQLLRDAVEQATARGVFGSPWFIVGDEPFWGHDRTDHLIDWINSGGW